MLKEAYNDGITHALYKIGASRFSKELAKNISKVLKTKLTPKTLSTPREKVYPLATFKTPKGEKIHEDIFNPEIIKLLKETANPQQKSKVKDFLAPIKPLSKDVWELKNKELPRNFAKEVTKLTKSKDPKSRAGVKLQGILAGLHPAPTTSPKSEMGREVYQKIIESFKKGFEPSRGWGAKVPEPARGISSRSKIYYKDRPEIPKKVLGDIRRLFIKGDKGK